MTDEHPDLDRVQENIAENMSGDEQALSFIMLDIAISLREIVFTLHEK